MYIKILTKNVILVFCYLLLPVFLYSIEYFPDYYKYNLGEEPDAKVLQCLENQKKSPSLYDMVIIKYPEYEFGLPCSPLYSVYKESPFLLTENRFIIGKIISINKQSDGFVQSIQVKFGKKENEFVWVQKKNLRVLPKSDKEIYEEVNT